VTPAPAPSPSLDAKDDTDAAIQAAEETAGKEAAGEPEPGLETTPEPAPEVAEPDAAVDPEGTDAPLPVSFPLACKSAHDCAVACGQGACVSGSCAFAAPQDGCVIANGDGTASCVPAGTASPGAACLVCSPGLKAQGWSAATLAQGFEAPGHGFAIEILGAPEARWQASTKRAAAGKSSLYFGNLATSNYDVGRAWGRAVSAPVLVPDGPAPRLRFAVWLQTEESSDFDVLRLSVEGGTDGASAEVWSSSLLGGTTGGNFSPVAVDLSPWAGQAVRLSFEFDSGDELVNGFEGAYLDEVRLQGGCCQAANDCDDLDGCTVDACPEAGQACEHTVKAECCNSDAGCEDGDACTVDACGGPGGVCGFKPIPGCCHANAECGDADPCTEDRCPAGGAQCQHLPLCCDTSADCKSPDPCQAGSCVEDQCVYVAACCESDAECDDGSYCTYDKCLSGKCQHLGANLPGCCLPEVAVLDFEAASADQGWTFEGTQGGYGWQVAEIPSYAKSGTHVLYYGNPSTLTYKGTDYPYATATSPTWDLPTEVEVALSFSAYNGTDPWAWDDTLSIEVKGAGNWFPVASINDLVNQDWTALNFDLSFLGGQAVSIRFRFESFDLWANQGLGIVIEDLQLITTCAAKECTGDTACKSIDVCVQGQCLDGTCGYVSSCCEADEECDDGLVCTTDTCQDGVCSFDKQPGCCESDFECDDQNACTSDLCTGVGGSCVHQAILDCCNTAGDCDDGDPCTLQACVEHLCKLDWICCATDSDCDDGDDLCTVDGCVSSFCVHTPTDAAGCCDEQPLSWSFETPVSFVTTQTSPPCGWQVVSPSQQSKSGAGALYYGVPAAWNFDCETNAGEATSQAITLLPYADYLLTMQVWLDIESGGYDNLWLDAVLEGGQPVTVWTKEGLSFTDYQTWTQVVVNLNAFAGETFQLGFKFDSKDGLYNTTAGVFVDDLAITSTCTPVGCSDDDPCDDGIDDSKESCLAGTCSYSF
jgi:hypothetical protein